MLCLFICAVSSYTASHQAGNCTFLFVKYFEKTKNEFLICHMCLHILFELRKGGREKGKGHITAG